MYLKLLYTNLLLFIVTFFTFNYSLLSQTNVNYKYKKTKSGLNYKLFVKGKGNNLIASQRVFVTYDLYHKKDSTNLKLIINKANKDFLLGHEEVLKGWDEGLALLKVGDSALLKIPPHLAYGDKKYGSILPNSNLYLFVRVDSAQTVFYHHTSRDTVKYQSGLKKIIFEKGNGKKALPYQEVIIKFTGYVYSTKGYRQIFEASVDDKKNRLFQLGIGQFVKGLDEGITGMYVGEKSTFIVPPHLGFGNKQAGRILPNTTLFFDIELIEAKNPFFDYSNKENKLIQDSVIVYFVEQVKEGEFINNENIVQFDYKAYYKDKNGYNILFDNSFQHQRSMMQRPGSGKGFPGIENAMLQLKKGEKATVVIPERIITNKKQLPFLDSGSFVYFDLYIHDVYNYQFINLTNNDTIKLSSGLKYLDVVVGDGQEIKKSDNVKVAYSIYYIDGNGKRILLDASRESEKWLDFIVGSGSNISGFENGVIGMKEGGMRRLIIPPQMGYGSDGLPERGVPKNTILIVDIEGIRINR